MTLFGTTLDGQQVFGLISLLTVLAFWFVVLRRERTSARHTYQKAREEVEKAKPQPSAPKPDDRPPTGPWG